MSHPASDDATTGHDAARTSGPDSVPASPDHAGAGSPFAAQPGSAQGSVQAGSTQPEFSQPRFSQPGFTAPEFTQPGFTAPEFTQPGSGAPAYPSFQPGNSQPPGVPQAYPPTVAGDPYAQRAHATTGQAPMPGVDPYAQAQQDFMAANPGATPPVPASLGLDAPPENVGRGILYALGGVLGGVLLAVLVYRLGFIASLTTYVMALLILRLYAVGSGGRVRKGVVPVIVLLVLGVVLTIMGYVGSDAFRYYGEHAGTDASISRASFVWQAMTTPSIYSDYGKDIVLTILFAVLGVFSTIRGLLRPGRRR